jgi:hypothetical protein
MIGPMTTTTVANQLARNTRCRARANAALSRWDEYDANVLLPADQRRPLERPTLTRGGLEELQVMLVERIGELDELFRRG